MKVFISNINVIEDIKCSGLDFCILGKLQSGLQLKIHDFIFDLREYIGKYLDFSFKPFPFNKESTD